jgi:hypothetical protein
MVASSLEVNANENLIQTELMPKADGKQEELSSSKSASVDLGSSRCSCLLCQGAQISGSQQTLEAAGFNIGSDDPTYQDYKWSQPGGDGSPIELTYSYSNLLNGGLSGIAPETIIAGVEEALSLWADVAPISFVEVPDDPEAATIRFGYDSLLGTEVGSTYYPGNSPICGDVAFDNSFNGYAWTSGSFLETALHEIGHALGLGHENTNDAIMNPYLADRFSGLGTGALLPDDIAGINYLYGVGEGSVLPLA